MKIEKIAVSEINPASYNPRIDLNPGDLEYEKLKKSIVAFGYVEPLVWNKRTKTLISGHQRLKVLIEQGIKEVEVSVVDLSREKEKTLNIALNKIKGNWNEEKLANLLEELKELPDFDVELTGFDAPEITGLLDDLKEIPEDDNFDFDKELELITEPVTKNGDLIELGKHRILCGDSSNPEDLKKLIGNSKIALVHTDPPYNVSYYGGSRPNAHSRPSKHKLWERIYSDSMSQDEYEVWLKKILANITPYLISGAPAYIWNGHKQFGPMHQILEELNFHISSVITWAKPNFAIGYGDYNQQTEFCLYSWKKGDKHIWYGPTNESTLWEIKRDVTKGYIHPTQKPIALAQRAIRNSSKREDIVLDLFLGSGSTLIAAESMGRSCFGIEIDPKYCDAIVKRYIAFVGVENASKGIKAKYLKEAYDEQR